MEQKYNVCWKNQKTFKNMHKPFFKFRVFDLKKHKRVNLKSPLVHANPKDSHCH